MILRIIHSKDGIYDVYDKISAKWLFSRANADNVLLHGMVESNELIPHKKRTMVVNLRKYLEAVNCYPYETELVRLEDGIAITRLKGE